MLPLPPIKTTLPQASDSIPEIVVFISLLFYHKATSINPKRRMNLMIRKALAAVISAAVVVSACLVPAFRSTAATLTPVNSDAGMDADGNIQTGND